LSKPQEDKGSNADAPPVAAVLMNLRLSVFLAIDFYLKKIQNLPNKK
jgi:hypothetical protein